MTDARHNPGDRTSREASEHPTVRATASPGLELSDADRAALSADFEDIERIGGGAMGVVYRARHKLLRQQRAIKVCRLDEHLERFHREAELLADVRSEHVVTVHDFKVLDGGRTALVMDWIDGHDLAAIIRDGNGPLSESRVVPWMEQVCRGMQATADRGIVHRDLKPANIIIDDSDDALVADFGLARAPDVTLTVTGGFMGTPLYTAPEQAEDPRRADIRADIYSFGATFYHALAGKPPFDDDSWLTVLLKHKTEPLMSPKTHNALLDDRVSECVERCMAKSPADRFQSFDEIRGSLSPMNPQSPWNACTSPDLLPFLSRYLERRDIYLGEDAAALPDADVYRLGPERRVTIKFGDLSNERVEAVVSSDDQDLSMGGGVSQAIARAGGPVVVAEAARYAPVRPGRAVVTSGGHLPARFVFHGITIGWERDVVFPSRDLILEIVDSCFYHADSLGVGSIAFPLLGSGVGRFPPAACLDTLFRGLIQKVRQGVTSVKDARIVLWPTR